MSTYPTVLDLCFVYKLVNGVVQCLILLEKIKLSHIYASEKPLFTLIFILVWVKQSMYWISTPLLIPLKAHSIISTRKHSVLFRINECILTGHYWWREFHFFRYIESLLIECALRNKFAISEAISLSLQCTNWLEDEENSFIEKLEKWEKRIVN